MHVGHACCGVPALLDGGARNTHRFDGEERNVGWRKIDNIVKIVNSFSLKKRKFTGCNDGKVSKL